MEFSNLHIKLHVDTSVTGFMYIWKQDKIQTFVH